MPDRSITIDGTAWRVIPSGRVTQYDRDEFGIMFVRGTGDARETRVSRYSPQQSRSPVRALAELSEEKLRELFGYSQPGASAPETGYRS